MTAGVTVSITEDQLYTALGNFLVGILGSSVSVIRGQVNRVSMPVGDFVLMTAMQMQALSTNKQVWTPGSVNPGIDSNSTSTQWKVQIDVFGPNAGTNVVACANLVRTSYACDVFTASGIDMQPLYGTEPRNMAIVNGEAQYENRWTFEFLAQFNPVISTPLDFAIALTIQLVEVDTTFH